MQIKREYLPSKKFVTSVCVAVFVVLIAIALNYTGKDKESFKNNLLVNENIVSASGTWADALENASTTIALPEEEKKTIETYKSLSPIDRLSRDLISNIVAYEPKGASFDDNTTQYVIDKTFQDIPSKNFFGITKEEDLNFSSDLGPAAITLFKNNYYSETETLKKILGLDLFIINSSITKDKDIPKDQIKIITDSYQKIISLFIKTKFPTIRGSSVATAYLILINDLEKLIQIDNDMVTLNLNGLDLYSDLNVYGLTFNDLISNIHTVDANYGINR
jgi:hypothetical protein